MSASLDLAGRVTLQPGQPLPTLHSSRPELAPRLAAGRLADELPTLMGALFTLCAHAHRLAARLAVAAARGGAATPTPADLQALRLATARDQVLRIAHDWPRLLPGLPMATPATDPLQLRACPLWRAELSPADQLANLPAWLQHKWLGMAPADWLQHHDADLLGWAARWCRQAEGPVAATLRPQQAACERLATPAHALDLLHNPALTMPMLARQMAQPGFCGQPVWQGCLADTGPWSRHHDPQRLPAHNAWMRLVSRLVDLLRLASPGGASWLAAGALPLPGGAGIAWVEMARGLLVHTVRLQPGEAGAEGESGDRVAEARVLAPTDWNFHPRGLLARALVPVHHADDARRLAVAFDPCVAFAVQLPARREAHHA
jgi:hypothetical protein